MFYCYPPACSGAFMEGVTLEADSWMTWHTQTDAYTHTHSFSSHICPPTQTITPNQLSRVRLSLSSAQGSFFFCVPWWIYHRFIFGEQHFSSHTLCGSALSLSVRWTWGYSRTGGEFKYNAWDGKQSGRQGGNSRVMESGWLKEKYKRREVRQMGRKGDGKCYLYLPDQFHLS